MIKYLILLFIIVPLSVLSQSETGFYMNWNRDHTGRTIKPMIPLSKEEAKVINCYWVEFDQQKRFSKVKYYNSGKPKAYSNLGAHELVRDYYKNGYEESFKDVNGNVISNSSGIHKYVYTLNAEGHWIEIENHYKEGKITEENGTAKIKVTRDYQNRILTEIQLNLSGDTIPDVNDFKVVHFTYDVNSYMTSRQNRNAKGKLQNGKYGYAKVIFQYDHNGMFYGEEFLDSEYDLVIQPSLGYSKIDFRDFNKYGKSKRQYFSDENGYPSASKAMAIIDYNKNMSREKVVFYNRIGEATTDFKGRAKIEYEYDKSGKFLGRKYYNLKNEKVE